MREQYLVPSLEHKDGFDLTDGRKNYLSFKSLQDMRLSVADSMIEELDKHKVTGLQKFLEEEKEKQFNNLNN